MVKQEDYSWCSSAMEGLKQAVIERCLSDIDLDNDIDLYDKIISEFAVGNLDDAFECPVFQGLTEDEKIQLLKRGRKYFPLCFSRGDINNWIESIDGISLGNYELICMKIFYNYNFILEQIKKDREYALERLKNFNKYAFGDESSVVEQIRYSFYSSKALDEVLSRMAKRDGEYSRFSDEHMSILCTNPEGTLYVFDENREPILYNFPDIQSLIVDKMEELDIDETDQNYFQKIVSLLSIEYSDELYGLIFNDDVLKLLK